MKKSYLYNDTARKSLIRGKEQKRKQNTFFVNPLAEVKFLHFYSCCIVPGPQESGEGGAETEEQSER